VLGYGYSFYKTESVEIAGVLGLNAARRKSTLTDTLDTAANGTSPRSTVSTNVCVERHRLTTTLVEW